MDEEESDYESSGFWKEKHDNALSALESCEKSKQMLEKHNEELRRKGDETRVKCGNLNTKINELTEKYKNVEKDREIIKNSKNEMSQTMANMKRELSAEREKTVQFRQKLVEKEAAIKQLIEEEKCISEVYEKSVVKSKALEEFGNELIAAKEHLESKVALYESKVLDKEAEIKQLQDQMKMQIGDFDELRKAVLGIISELGSLKDSLEENRQKKIVFSQGIVDLRKRFQAKNEQLADECYARTLDLKKAQKDCEMYCKKIKDLETAFAATRKNNNTKDGETLKAALTFKEDELKHINDSATAKRTTELESQISSYRQEIQDLRELLSEERLTRLQLEGKYDRYCEDGQRWKELDVLQNDMEGVTKISNVKMQGIGMNRETTMKLNRELTRLFGETMDPENEKGKSMKDSEKSGKDDYKLEEELNHLRKKCSTLADRNEELRAENEWLSSMHDEKREEPFALKSDMDSLKQQVSKLQESTVDVGAGREDIDRLKSQCAALNEEKSALMKVVDDLKIEECSLTKEIEDIRQSQCRMKQDRTISNFMTYELDRGPTEGRYEKDLMARKVEEMEKEHKQRILDMEKQWAATLAEKEKIYEAQLEKRETNGAKVKQLEEELREKESQFQIKKGEVKRILIQYSDLKNEKVRCETKLESLQVTERMLSAKVHMLEAKVTQLEQHEKEYIKKLEEKEIEKMKLNEDWRKAALESVNELKRAMIE